MLNHCFLHYFLCILLFLAATDACSKNISFNYAEGNFVSSTINLRASPKELEGNGIGFNLSLSFHPRYAITASVLATTFNNFQHIPVDTIKTTDLGVTAHTSIAERSEVFGNISLLRAEITSDNGTASGNDNDIGYQLKAGLRHFISESLELETGITHFYIFNYPDNTLNLEMRYYTDGHFSLGIAYAAGGHKDSLSVNGRMSF